MRKRVYTLPEVKRLVEEKKNCMVHLKISMGRKKYKDVSGVVKDIYPALFTVDCPPLLTLSYSLVACGEVRIKE